MRWGDTITLIKLDPPIPPVNERGYPNLPVETGNEVYCNRRSIGMTEFYQAANAGYKVDAKIEVRSIDYAGQTMAEFEGKRYRILRTYTTGSGELTELTLSDLSEKG